MQKKDPMAYRQLKAAEAEQKSYEEELKRCRTKEEVSRVRMAHTSASLSVVNSVKNNPNIPEGQKLALVSGELRKVKALDKINSLKQVFGVSLRYYYDNGTSEATGTASSQVSVAAEVSTTEKVSPVITTEFSLAETEIEGGKEYSGAMSEKEDTFDEALALIAEKSPSTAIGVA